ncbi:MAG: hypothetical protein ACI9N1_001933 [Flavobacteriales bacterium]
MAGSKSLDSVNTLTIYYIINYFIQTMKNIISALLLSFVSIVCISQTPSKINYQAIARDGSGVILANQSINASVKILALTATGTVVYHETHSVSTNEFGLFYFKIGEGVPTFGTSLADVNWQTGPKFVSVNVNGDDLGTTELVSVPYSLHSASAGGINGVNITTNAPANGEILSYNSTSLQWELVTGGSSTDDQNIESLGLAGTTLTVGIENGSAQTVDLSSLQDGVADADSVIGNEYVNSFDTLNGNLELIDGGSTFSVPLSALGGGLWSSSLGNVYPATLTDNIGIGTNAPDVTLDVVGNFQLDDGTQAAGYVLTSDAVGNASWQSTGGAESHIQDLDGDTFVETDTSSNGTGDVIDFNLGGVNHFRMNGPTLETLNSGFSVFIGEGAGLNDDLTSNEGVFVGYGAGGSNTTGARNVAIGYVALSVSSTTDDNTAIGYSALRDNTDGYKNTAVGAATLFSNTLGIRNTAMGAGSMDNNTTGNNNSALGFNSLYSNTFGTDNSSLGYISLWQNTTGSNNTGIGQGALSNNTTGSNNTALGVFAGTATSGLTNATAIGANTAVSASNSLVLGNNANVGIGTSAPTELLYLLGSDADMDLETVDNSESSSLHFRRARGTNPLSPLSVNNGDFFANIEFQGYTGGSYENGARIEGSVDGATGSTSMPGKLVFYTTADGTIGDQERMRISNNGRVAIDTAVATSTLHVNGSYSAKVRTHNVPITLTEDDQVSIWTVSTPSASTSVTLPSADFCKGRIYRIAKVASLGALNSMMVNTTGDLIDGQSSVSISSVYSGGIEVISDGADWYILSKF